MFQQSSKMTSNEEDNFCRMQHLIDEMDRSNQRINLFNEKFDVQDLGQGSTVKRLSPLERQFDLLEDACRSEESDGTSVHEIPPSRFCKNLEDSGCEEVLNSAIAEVSKDFLSGLQTSGTQNQCGDSDESRISSDTDFKLIGGMPSYARYPETAAGLSDTDWNPYGTESDNNQSPHSQSAPSFAKESKSNATTPFLPILSSTGLNAITPNSDDKIVFVDSQQSHLSNIREISEQSSLARLDLKPDVSDDIGHLTRKADWAITPQRGRRQQPSSILNQIMKSQEQDQIIFHERDAFKTRHDGTSPKESASSDEEKKMIASTSSTGYSSAASGTKANVEIPKEKTAQDMKSQHMSVFERAKLMGIPEDILFDKSAKNKAHFTNGLYRNERVTSGGLSDYDSDDPLAHKVKHILSETAYLSSGAEKANYNKPTVDYNLLKKDLQEIQDNLESLSSGSPADLKKLSDGSSLSSDKEGDIPSTASTPDKNRNGPIWDFAEVIGSLADRIHPNASQSQKSGMKRVILNSDGDETRSSDSSHKSDDHNAVSESQKPNLGDLHTSHDIDEMLSTFRDQRHQLESRYQQLNNQGLAEKVFRILTNQDPESQANGILSEVSAEEKEMRAKMVLKQHTKDFNFSSNSSLMEDSYRSLGLPDDIRKKLDLSGISSVDSSKVFDRSSFNLPSSSKGFSAFDDAKRFLSSQMAKASERTFNHSIEMKYPQSIQCYPLFMDKSDKENGGIRKEEKDSNLLNAVTSEETATETHTKDTSSSQQNKERPDISPQELLGKQKRESPPSTDLGSVSKSKEKYRPYRPPGSKEVYYTESDTASVADSVTTMESTHIGSDDAAGPHLPLSAYGSRKEAPNVDGIYGTRKNLSTVQEGSEPSSLEEKSSQDGKENKPSQIWADEIPTRQVQSGIPSQQRDSDNGRLRQAVTTERYSTSIWAKREEQPHTNHAAKWEEKSEQRVPANMLSQDEPGPSSHNVSTARRNARWANRMDEQNRDFTDLGRRNVESDRLLEHITSQRPSRFTERDVSEATMEGQDRTNLREDFTLPTNAFVRHSQNSPGEREPMSLRIKFAYTDTNKARERSPERDESSLRFGNDSRSQFMDRDYNFRISGRNRYEPDEHSMRHQNLVRSASDENLNATQRDARLSPAFRRALSPELMTSIGSRSPILGRSIERSLARPPSDYPLKPETNRSTSPLDRRPYSLSDPPTFLARERSMSPRQYVTSPRNEQRSNQPLAYTRNLSLSPQEELLSHDVRSRNQHMSCDRYETDERRQNSPGRYAPRQPSPILFTKRQHTVERRQDTNDRYAVRRSSPGSVAKRKVELTLEGMSSESEADKEIDTEPISKRAQLLKDALSHQQEPNISPDINEMWDQFKAYNESDDSSVNTARMEAVADLLKSPSTHLVSQYLKEREEYRIERQERVEREKEKRMKEHVHKSSSSEDDLNERYQELLMAKEEERMKRRSVKKKKGKNGEPGKASDAIRDKKNGEDKCAESLYSIPEDRSFEQSPGKLSSAGPKVKPQVCSQPNVIDPNMIKLRDKISNQRNKVNRDMMKEIIRIDKLKKLEDLLKAKRKGKITSQMLEQQLEELSSTSHTVSDQSHENVKFMEPNSVVLSDDSTTAKDSSGEMRMWKMRKENRHKDLEMTEEHGDKLRSKNSRSYNNKENQSKGNVTCPKDFQRQSEMKLLKLVKEGYLTADEAYKVAVARTRHKEAHLEEDMSATLSENDSSFGSNRPHKFYSPYSRSPTFTSQIRHVPKLKFSESVVDDSFKNGSYWLGNEKQGHRSLSDFRQSNIESRSSQHSKSSMKQGIPKEDRDSNFISSVPGIYKRDRGRPRSQSPSNATRQRHTGQKRILLSSHQSPVRSHSTSPARSVKDSNNFSVKGKHGHFFRGRKYRSENDPPNMKKDFGPGVAWHIDMNSPPDQWKEPAPLQEIPLNKLSGNRHLRQTSDMEKKHYSGHLKKPSVEQNIWQKSHRPHGISKLEWEEVVSQDALASKTNHWEVDPIMDRVQYILNKPSAHLLNHQSSLTSGKDVDSAKSLSRLSLQEAFLHRKQDFISRCRERQKRLALSKGDRQMQECLRLEREAIFAEQERMGVANVYAHPYSDNLHHPKRRLLTKQEMKEMTARKYKNLPEVIEKKEENRRKIEYKLNRLRANLFNKKVQKEILKKRYKQRG